MILIGTHRVMNYADQLVTPRQEGSIGSSLLIEMHVTQQRHSGSVNKIHGCGNIVGMPRYTRQLVIGFVAGSVVHR